MLESNDVDIEAIILDIGGVIWLPNDVRLSDKWAVRCDLDADAFDRIVYASDWGKQAMLGTIKHTEFWTRIGEDLNLSGNALRELEADYWDGVWDTNVLDLCRTLQPQYQLGIVSDAFSDARKTVRPWVSEDLFDVIIFSAEEGVCKPDPRIFHKALQELEAASAFIGLRLNVSKTEVMAKGIRKAILPTDAPATKERVTVKFDNGKFEGWMLEARHSHHLIGGGSGLSRGGSRAENLENSITEISCDR